MAEAEGTVFKPLIGFDEATIDDKGRILIGKKKRERLGESFAIYLSEVGCLVACPESIWLQKVGDMMRYDSLNMGRAVYTRMMLSYADDELKFDGQGRVVVPQKLRDVGRLKLNDRVVLIGCGDRMEIWAEAEYERYLEDPEGYGFKRREQLKKAYDQMVGRE